VIEKQCKHCHAWYDTRVSYLTNNKDLCWNCSQPTQLLLKIASEFEGVLVRELNSTEDAVVGYLIDSLYLRVDRDNILRKGEKAVQ
jgi:hypothetical protein